MNDTELLAIRIRAAERMGWTCISADYQVGLPPHKRIEDIPTDLLLKGEADGFMWNLPNYPSDLNAAMTLRDKLWEKGYIKGFTLEEYPRGRFTARFSICGESFYETADSPALAITLAALVVFDRMEEGRHEEDLCTCTGWIDPTCPVHKITMP